MQQLSSEFPVEQQKEISRKESCPESILSGQGRGAAGGLQGEKMGLWDYPASLTVQKIGLRVVYRATGENRKIQGV